MLMTKVHLIQREEIIQNVLAKSLQQFGYDVVASPNPKIGRKDLQGDPDIDVVLLDYHFPDNMTIEFLKAAATDRRLQQVPILLTCRTCENCVVEASRDYGAVGVLAMPAEDAVLQRKVEQAVASGKRQVLVVDDEEVIRDILETFLRLERFRALTAASGDEALALMAEHDVHAVISDILMPGMNGMELLVRIKEERPEIPVIMITGHAGRYTPENILSSGADGYFTKPFKNVELIATLRKVLHAKSHAARKLPRRTRSAPTGS
ncbi:response regulator [candidate division GN15 bacterium]|nr:response regulator [candidate division GN15 bacterium]